MKRCDSIGGSPSCRRVGRVLAGSFRLIVLACLADLRRWDARIIAAISRGELWDAPHLLVGSHRELAEGDPATDWHRSDPVQSNPTIRAHLQVMSPSPLADLQPVQGHGRSKRVGSSPRVGLRHTERVVAAVGMVRVSPVRASTRRRVSIRPRSTARAPLRHSCASFPCLEDFVPPEHTTRSGRRCVVGLGAGDRWWPNRIASLGGDGTGG
jgi:hypothetical protein